MQPGSPHHTAHLLPPPLGMGPITQPHQAVRSQHHTATGWPRSMQESGLAPRGHLVQGPPTAPSQSRSVPLHPPPWYLVAGLEGRAGLYCLPAHCHRQAAPHNCRCRGAVNAAGELHGCVPVLSVRSLGAFSLHSHTTSTLTVKVVACEPAGQPVAD